MRFALLAGVLWLAEAAADASEIYYDYAPVVETRAIIDTRPVAVKQRRYQPQPGPSSEAGEPGDVRALQPGASISEIILAEQRLRKSAQPRCQEFTSYRNQEAVVGYWVTYRYAGDLIVKRMEYDPGERIKVRVELDPL